MARKKDVEKTYSNKESVAKLRRLAEALENGEPYEIQIDNKRIYVPADASVEFELEHDGEEMELAVEVKWKKQS
jgi:amphi-Trp domain-containing protein